MENFVLFDPMIRLWICLKESLLPGEGVKWALYMFCFQPDVWQTCEKDEKWKPDLTLDCEENQKTPNPVSSHKELDVVTASWTTLLTEYFPMAQC